MEAILLTDDENGGALTFVSPVRYGKKLLIITFTNSKEYRQLCSNPNCNLFVSVGDYMLGDRATFEGSIMSSTYIQFREAYCKKFPDAFIERVPRNGIETVFIWLTLVELKYSEDTEDEICASKGPIRIDLEQEDYES